MVINNEQKKTQIDDYLLIKMDMKPKKKTIRNYFVKKNEMNLKFDRQMN